MPVKRPIVYRNMRCTVLWEDDRVYRGVVVRATESNRFRVKRVSVDGVIEGGAPRTFLRRDRHTMWAKGWDGSEADAFRARSALLRD